MSLLLDTHVFLWYLAADARLSAAWLAAIRSPTNLVYASVASVWEATIKFEAGKLPLPDHPTRYLTTARKRHHFHPLDIDDGTVASLAGLPAVHRDPFDRILVAQALQHDLTLLTVDANVRSYPVKLLPL